MSCLAAIATVGAVVCCKDYSVTDLAKPMPPGSSRPSSALSRPSSAATGLSRPSSAGGALTGSRPSSAAALTLGRVAGEDNDDNDDPAFMLTAGADRAGGADGDYDYGDSSAALGLSVPGTAEASASSSLPALKGPLPGIEQHDHSRPASASAHLPVGYGSGGGDSSVLDGGSGRQKEKMQGRPASAGSVVRFDPQA
eukprot:COSAG06_NODE_818_length_12113_cov_9.211670_11_plen_197_part_00